MFSPDIPKIFSRLFPGVPEVCPVGGLLAFYVTCLKLLSGHGGMIGLCVCGRAWAHQCQHPWETLSQWGYEFQSPSLFLRGQLKGLSTPSVGWSSQDWALAPQVSYSSVYPLAFLSSLFPTSSPSSPCFLGSGPKEAPCLHQTLAQALPLEAPKQVVHFG